MLRVNDDKDDELFRKAAENYSLGADAPDWDFFIRQQNTLLPSAARETAKKEKINATPALQGIAVRCFKKNRQKCLSFFRFFGFTAWSGKIKKKITRAYFFPLVVRY